MSAAIENGMFRVDPWHHLGTIVGDTFTWEQAVADGQPITLTVEKIDLADLVIGHEFAFPQFAAVREDGKILYAGHGDQWTPFQPFDAYEFAEAVRGNLGGRLESLGTLHGGRQYFMTYDLGEFFIGDYAVKDHLTSAGSFDGSLSHLLLSSQTVVVCANTLAMARAAGVVHYQFKHTSGIFDRVEEAKRAIRRHEANRDAYKALGEQLMSTKVGQSQYRDILNRLFPVGEEVSTKTNNANENARDLVNALWTATSDGLDVVGGVEGSAWALVQSVNTYENWGQPIRKTKGEGETTTRALRQMEQIVSGRQPLTDKALELVLA